MEEFISDLIWADIEALSLMSVMEHQAAMAQSYYLSKWVLDEWRLYV